MKLVFLDGRTPFSLLIRWVTSPKIFGLADSSHFAYVFEVNGQGVVFESDLMGCHLGFWKRKQEKSRITETLELYLSPKSEDDLWDVLVKSYDGRKWDWMGAAYLAKACLKRKFFGSKLPEKNKWAKSDAFFCNELITALNLVYGLKKIGFDASVFPPEDMRPVVRQWVKEGQRC